MKLLPLLLAVCAVAFANYHSYDDQLEQRSEWLESLVKNDRRIVDNKFESGREYKFFYNGQLTSGIPGTSQLSSGTRIQSLVSIVFKSSDEALLKLVNTRFGKLNEQIPEPRSIMPFEAFEQLEINPEIEETLKLTVQFNLRHGLVSDIEFDGEEQPWSANIKRAVLNMLQLNLKKENRIEDMIVEELPTKTVSFSVLEKTIEGECETLYTVVPKPVREEEEINGRLFEVTKSINFENCISRPEVHYNERFQQICPTCEPKSRKQERNLVSNSVIRMEVVCPENLRECLVRKSDVQSQYSYVIFNEEHNTMTSFVRQYLKLVETCEPETEIRRPENKITSDSQMVYNLDWDLMKEEFYMQGEDMHTERMRFAKIEHKIRFIDTLLKELIHYTRESVKEEAPMRIYRLVRVLRTMKLDDLKKVHETFFRNTPNGFTREEHMKVKDFLMDSIALCGTKDCIEHLVHVIKNDELSTIKASMVIRKLMDVHVVNENMIKTVYDICETTDMCERSEQIKQAVYLTCGSMMRTLCLPVEDTTHKPAMATKYENYRERLCPIVLREKFVKTLIEKFESTESEYTKVLVLKTLSNSGLKEILPVLNKIIKTDSYSPMIRNEAIMAMMNLETITPKQIQRILLPVFMNVKLPSEIRMIAAYQIMITQPDKLVIDQIVRQLNSERHPQVFSFTVSMLKTLVNSEIQCSTIFQKDVKLALRQLRSSMLRKNPMNSWQWRVYESVSTKKNFGGVLDLFKVETDTTTPFGIGAALNLNLASLWSPKFVGVRLTQTGMSRVLNQIWRSHSHNMQSSLSDLISGKFEMPSPRFNYRTEMKEMFNQFNIDTNELTSEFEPFSALQLLFKNQEYAFLPVSREMITQEFINMYTSSDWNKLVKMAERGLKDTVVPFSFHTATFVHEQSRKIPTTLGLPIRVSMVVPTVIQATGTLKIDFSKNPLKKMKVVVKDLKPSLAVLVESKMECWSPIVNTGVKVIAQAKLYTPMELTFGYDMTKTVPKIEMIVSPIVKDTKEVLTLHTRPVTFCLVWPTTGMIRSWIQPEERTIHNIDWSSIHQHNKIVGEHSFGVKFHSRAHWYRMPKVITETEINRPISSFSILSGPNKYILTVAPGHEMPKEFIMVLSGKMFEQLEKKQVRNNFNKFFEDSSENFLSEESSEEQSFEEEKYSKVYSGNEPINNQIDIKLSTKGSSIKREAKILTKWICDETSKICQLKFTIDRTPVPTKENKPWRLVSEIELVYPKSTPLHLNEFSSEHRLMSKITTKWGPKEQPNKKFNVKVIGEQSLMLRSLMESSLYKRLFDNEQHRNNYRSLFSPVAQFKQTLKYGIMDEIKIDVDYKMTPSEEDYLNQLYRLIKHMYFEESTVRMSTSQRLTNEGRVQIKLNVDPITRQHLNATIMTPFDETHIVDMPMYMRLPSMLNLRKVSTPSRSFYHMISRWFSSPNNPVCEARTNLITTFNNRQMPVPTSTCYSVLAKDCSSEETSKFAVLVKKQSPTTERKTLKIVTEPLKLVIRVNSADNLECLVNGESKPCRELELETIHKKHVAVSCRLDSESLIECQLPEAGISVFFDGYAVDVKVSPLYSSSVCGLCGVMSSNVVDVVEPRSLFNKFLYKETEQEQCEHEFNEQSTPIKNWSNSLFDDEDLWINENEHIIPEYLDMPVRERNSIVRPIRKTMIIEQNHELCFSQEPIKVCPRDTHPVKRSTRSKATPFVCLPRHSVEADRLVRLMREDNIVSDEVRELTSLFSEKVTEPTECRHYY